MRRRKDPFLPKDRIDDKAQDALDALDRIKKKGLSNELQADIDEAKNKLREIKRDNHHQA
jgi:hypothetical protein